ncbi:hypothetical protein [Methylobacterium gnaphalii]|uniref:Uncharacterized protein n=1 Tax=Methylobacterium gnaphalii TaxID=1010610 RepID=A0A512JH30_9HYPH|nr:hypothetical protein [Methylobacterium gnaphalii]GEP09270.1 hypothetical protein MGN01_11150 [Methylobacterium gnaphalii]GJD69051.1 hypothetical protein MMMDOFMJ_1977 [Methylobacterium gnaphalii]GLS50997.1 hypothetical protein GCM10007885_38510 [Methylobacterium gnaphalii]
MQIPAQRPQAAPPSKLAVIICELAERGIETTPLAIIARATDLGLPEHEIDAMCVKLASSGAQMPANA